MERQEGYYWVKYKGDFEVAKYEKFTSKNYWFRIETPDYYTDSDFEHINEVKIKEPGELPD